MARKYYSLIASLPHLPHFDRAERAPINEVRLRQRARMLDPEDAAQLARAWSLVAWQLQPVTRTDAQITARYETVMGLTSNAALRDFLEHRIGHRTALAALRRRSAGLGPPPEGEAWGVRRFRLLLAARWEVPDFGLTALFPWLPEVQRLLEGQDAVGFQRVLMEETWSRLQRLGEAHPFQFEEVFAYVFRWDMLNRWVAYDAATVRERFEELVTEVIGEHGQELG